MFQRITKDDLQDALQWLKNKKSTRLRQLVSKNICWQFGRVPEYNMAIIIPIYKRGQRNDCRNYDISLLNTGYKLYAKIPTTRLGVTAEQISSNAQHGFRKGISCSDCIFLLHPSL